MSNKNKKTGMKIVQKICFIIQLQKTLLCAALELKLLKLYKSTHEKPVIGLNKQIYNVIVLV